MISLRLNTSSTKESSGILNSFMVFFSFFFPDLVNSKQQSSDMSVSRNLPVEKILDFHKPCMKIV